MQSFQFAAQSFAKAALAVGVVKQAPPALQTTIQMLINALTLIVRQLLMNIGD
jgi:hypothetical protein